MESTPVGRMGTASLILTLQSNTVSEWQCSNGQNPISQWRLSRSLGPTSLASRWQRGSDGSTLWDIISPLTTPRQNRALSPRSRRGPRAPNFWWREISTLSCWIRRSIGGDRKLRLSWQWRALNVCWCISYRSVAHGAGMGACGA